jgi:hypothetical protein
MLRRRILLAGLAACAVAGAALLWWEDPASSSSFLPCPVRALTGLYCTGCGAQRAIHRLLHGDIAAAFRMNALLVALAPLVALGLLQQVFPGLLPRWAPERASPRSIWLMFALLVGFGIARNLPFEPLRWLAPH